MAENGPNAHVEAKDIITVRTKGEIRNGLSFFFTALPSFRGKGRLVLFCDRLLTDYSNPASYLVTGKINGEHKFRFDLRPWGQKFAYYYRSWERDFINVLRCLYSGDIFLDVGSSLGLYAVCLGDKVRRHGGAIISIEPVPFNMLRQKENVKLNKLEDLVTFFEVGLGSGEARVKIITDPDSADNNAIISDNGNFEIQVVTLDSLAAEQLRHRIGLMKIDVEGYEPMVIEGARNTIIRDRPIIFAEFNRERMVINGFTMDETWRFLTADLDYQCFILSRADGRLHMLKTPGMHENLFFVPYAETLSAGMCA